MNLKNNDIEKLMAASTQCRVFCKCGWSRVITHSHEKLICHNCGNYIYRTKQIEFKEKMKQLLRRNKNENS